MDSRPRPPGDVGRPPARPALRTDRGRGPRARRGRGPCRARRGRARHAVPAHKRPPSARRRAASVNGRLGPARHGHPTRRWRHQPLGGASDTASETSGIFVAISILIGLLVGLVVDRWWAALISLPLGLLIWIVEDDYEGLPDWSLGLIAAVLVAAGVGFGLLLRRAVDELRRKRRGPRPG